MAIYNLVPLRIITTLSIISLPSRIPLIFLLPFIFLFILFNLILVHLNIVSSILSWYIRISRLFSPVMKSCFCFGGLFLVFELLLGLISEVDFLFRFDFLFLVAWHEVILLHFSFVVFYFTSYFCVVDAFEILLYGVFAVFGV